MTVSPPKAVNHHADRPGFAGLTGLLAAVTMLVAGRSRARLIVDVASVSDTDRVVDIGCGPGSAVRAAARRGALATGVEPAPVMLALARLITRDDSRVAWLAGAAEDMRLPDGSATVAWSLATVHHWKDVTAGLAEAKRVLASGGRFLVLERCVHPGAKGLSSHGWTEQQAASFTAQCRVAGFQSVSTEQHITGRHRVWVVRAIRP
jgi:ubiquinone/menaquinone biosynthesis C-methylase UbiE